jgi:hypothetical protein
VTKVVQKLERAKEVKGLDGRSIFCSVHRHPCRRHGVFEGAKDIILRAKEKAKRILAEHKPTHLSFDTIKELDKAVLSICKIRGVQLKG